MLEVKHISKRFGEHQVLADVSLKVNQGDVVVILGPLAKRRFWKYAERRPLSSNIIISLPIKQPLKIS